MRILVVRLSALGDLVHAMPAVAALRRSFPSAEIDWLLDDRYKELVDLVSVVDNRFTLARSGFDAWSSVWRVARVLRRRRYDIVIDVQGLLKSAVAARLCGARRIIGFDTGNLREPAARWLYNESIPVGDAMHVVEKNLALVRPLVGECSKWEFPISKRPSEALNRTWIELGLTDGDDFALLHPGTAWPTKCWSPERYAILARRLWRDLRLRSAVLWGPGEERMAHKVCEASEGASVLTPSTTISDMVAHMRAAAVVVAGDTGPFHVAAAVGTPVVGIYGPSDPERNGPWSPIDQVISPAEPCRCRVDRKERGSTAVVVRQCFQDTPCVDEIEVEDVFDAVERRLNLQVAHD